MPKRIIFFFILTTILLTGCAKPAQETPSDFGFVFKYGVDAKNVLDTFEQTYTKDMVVDKPVTTQLQLSTEQLDAIYKKMVEIDFFSYPVKYNPGKGFFTTTERTPFNTYYFKVRAGGKTKELTWEDRHMAGSRQAKNLRELIQLIRNTIENTPEYKKMPPAKGGYM